MFRGGGAVQHISAVGKNGKGKEVKDGSVGEVPPWIRHS